LPEVQQENEQIETAPEDKEQPDEEQETTYIEESVSLPTTNEDPAMQLAEQIDPLGQLVPPSEQGSDAEQLTDGEIEEYLQTIHATRKHTKAYSLKQKKEHKKHRFQRSKRSHKKKR
jgi:hypothetical protein